MKPRLIVLAIIACLLAMAVTISFLAKPAGAQSAVNGQKQQLVCMYVFLPAEGSKRPIART